MAEKTQPGDTSQISRKRARTLTNASSESTSDLLHTEPIRISQRIRTNSSKVLEKENATQDSLPEVSFERRRVNPESLALRLGPELVRDLDSLIPPGSRDMPSFAARKELQERHKVDRRHIYDYYHSKGLRVVKEDKHGNPIRQVEQPTLTSEVYQPSRRMLRTAPSKTPITIHNHTSHSSDINHKSPKRKYTLKSRALIQTNTRIKKPRKNPAKQDCTSDQFSASCKPKRFKYPQIQHDYTAEKPSHLQNWNNTSQTRPELDEVQPTQYKEHSSFCADYPDLYPDSLEVPQSSGTVSAFVQSHAIFEAMNSTLDSETELQYPSTEPNVFKYTQIFTHPTDQQLITQNECVEFYDILDRVLGPASGIQQSVGTYKAYMEEQSRVYFERLLPESHYHMRKVQAQTYVRSQTMAQAREHEHSSVNFRKWLASDETSFDAYTRRNLTSQKHPANRGMAAAQPFTHLSRKKRGSNTLFREQNLNEDSHVTEHCVEGTLDDLFPRLNPSSFVMLEEPMGSPVLRSSSVDDRSTPLDVMKGNVVDEDGVPTLPELELDSPSTQQLSPDAESSPFLQTPNSVYQQFTQHKNPRFPVTSLSHLARWKSTIHDDQTLDKRETYDVLGSSYPQTLSSLKENIRLPEHARLRIESSGTRISRSRTASAGGGI